MTIKQRTVVHGRPAVAAIGLGSTGMSEFTAMNR